MEEKVRVLVTGGAGFIGSNLVKALLEKGWEVRVIDNLISGKRENLPEHENLKFYKKDILDRDLDEVFDGVEIVFHLAALPRVQFSIQNPEETHETHVDGTFNLLRICKEKKVKRFVFTSSSSVYGDQDSLPLIENMIPNPMSPYALHKLIGEEYCKVFWKVYGLKTVSLRYFNVYGPGQDSSGEYAILIPKFISKLKKDEKVVINGSGEQTRDFTYVSDVVEANIKAALCENGKIFGESFNIGAGENVSVNKVTSEIVKLCGGKGKVEHGPSVIEPKDALASIDKAREFLGWEPKIKFDDGLKLSYDSY